MIISKNTYSGKITINGLIYLDKVKAQPTDFP